MAEWSIEDRDAVETALPKDAIEAVGRPRPQGPKRVVAPAWSYRRNIIFSLERLMFTLRCKHPELLELPWSQRFNPQSIASFVEISSINASPASVSDYIQWLETAASRLGPTVDFRWMLDLSYRMQPTKKPQDALPFSSDDLYAAGVRLMDEAEHRMTILPDERFKLAARFRDGLILALLARHPLRVENFAELTIGESFRRLSSEWVIDLQAEKTKTGQRIVQAVESKLTSKLDAYVTRIRPLFPGAQWSNRLFLTGRGEKMSSITVAHHIVERTLEAIGVRVNAHKFRHALADQGVEGFLAPGDASLLLSHADPDRTRTTYRTRTNKAARVTALDVISNALKS